MKILPFNGLLYNSEKIDIKDVITLPYDKISPQKKEEYLQKSPYNMVRLILPESYEKARMFLDECVQERILVEDPKEYFYVYKQNFSREGISYTRTGLVGIVELKPFSPNIIMPHERIFPKIKEDRIRLLSTCRANLGQIFILYTEAKLAIEKIIEEYITTVSAVFRFRDEYGIEHILWRITCEERIKEISSLLEHKPLFIADGHHRYSAALEFKERERARLGSSYTGDEPFNFRMATFVDADTQGLVILPTHRVIKIETVEKEKLLNEAKKFFYIRQIPNIEHLEEGLNSLRDRHVIGMCYRGGFYVLQLKEDINLEKLVDEKHSLDWLYLDVNILHLIFLKKVLGIDTDTHEDESRVKYIREVEEAVREGDSEGSIVFLLNPTTMEEVKRIVAHGELMPHKSTDFYPKLYSGLVMRRI